jgi:hypothetical protein
MTYVVVRMPSRDTDSPCVMTIAVADDDPVRTSADARAPDHADPSASKLGQYIGPATPFGHCVSGYRFRQEMSWQPYMPRGPPRIKRWLFSARTNERTRHLVSRNDRGFAA